MIRSAVRLPMPGTAWKRPASPAAIAAISSRGGAAREDRERHLRPDRLHGEQHQEQVALLLGVKAEQRERVVAHDQVRVQRDLLADRRHVAQRLCRDGRAVADAVAQDHDVVGAAYGHLSAQQRDHAPARASALDSGAQLAWQIATASASAAWSGRGSCSSASSALTMRAT